MSNRKVSQGQNFFYYFRRVANILPEKKLHKKKSKNERRILLRLLKFLTKLRCSLKIKWSSSIFLFRFRFRHLIKKKKSLYLFSCSDFLSFVPKLRCSLKKWSSRISYLSISAPNVFQQSCRPLLRNLHYSQKTENRCWAALKRAANWTTLALTMVTCRALIGFKCNCF